MIQFEKHVLPNGLRVFLVPMHETQAVTVLFMVNVGSRYETDKQNGLSHFLEHMFFKGTEKRPTTLDISQELDALGADYNAFTSEELTGYYVSSAAEHFPIAFDVLTDMLYGSKFDKAEIEKEKGVICEEIKMYADNPRSYLNEIGKTLAYGSTPLGRDVAGKPETVKSFDQKDFLDYKNQNYGPENTILVIAGNPNNYQWLKTVTDTLSRLKPSQPAAYEPQQVIKDGPQVKIGHRPIDQMNVSLMHYAVSHTDPRYPTAHVLANILGGTMSSRLFVEIREKRGLAYGAWAYVDAYHDTGTLDCCLGVDPAKLEEALTVTLDEMDKLTNEPVSDIELNRAKQNIKGKLSLRLEDSHSIARYIASEELEYGGIKQPEEYIKLIEKVTKSDIMELAKELFQPANRKLAIVGPIKEDQEEILRELINR